MIEILVPTFYLFLVLYITILLIFPLRDIISRYLKKRFSDYHKQKIKIKRKIKEINNEFMQD